MKKIILIIYLLFILIISSVDSNAIEYGYEVKVVELSLGSFKDIINMNYRYNLKEDDTWKCDEGVRYVDHGNFLINYKREVKTCIIISQPRI